MAPTHVHGVREDEEIRDQLATSGRKDVEAPVLEQVLDDDEQYFAKYNDSKYAHLSSFEKLEKLHKIPPALASYDASAPLTTLMSFSGTGLQLALQRGVFWVLFLIHVVLSIMYYRSGYGISGGIPLAPGWPKVGLSLIAIPGGLTTFVLVFYLNQAFHRYLQQNGNCFGSIGALGEFVLLLRLHLHDGSFPGSQIVRHELCKLINALHVLTFTMHPQYRDNKIDKWGWWFLLQEKLLTPGQVEELKPLAYHDDGRLAFREVVLWVDRAIWAQQSKGFIDSKVATLFTNKIWDVRKNLEELYTFISGPVPFAYFHLLNFMVLIYLLFLSYAFIFIAPCWSIPGFFLVLVGLLGIRELGNAMSNPIGDDKLDIPVFHNVNLFLKQSTMLIDRNTSYGDELEDLRPPDSRGATGAFALSGAPREDLMSL